jgi:hypothetical protein
LARRFTWEARRATAGDRPLSHPAEYIARELRRAGVSLDDDTASMTAFHIEAGLREGGWDIARTAKAADIPQQMSSIGWDKQVTRDQLVPGRIVFREAQQGTDEKVRTATPCCGRRVELQPVVDVVVPVVCPFCAVLFDAEVVEEPDSGGYDDTRSFVVMFVVSSASGLVTAKRHSPTRKENV